MKRRLLMVVAVAGLALTQPLLATETLKPGDFALRVPLSVAQPDGLQALELSEAVYRAGTTRSLADLRIFNAKGEPLVWALLPMPAPEKNLGTPVELTLVPLPQRQDMRALVLKSYAVRVEGDERRAVVEVAPLQRVEVPPAEIGGYLIDARGAKDLSGQLSLVFDSSAADYAERVEILGSEDLVNWRTLASGPLALDRKLGEPVERSTYELRRPPPFLRVQWPGARAPQIVGARFTERTMLPTALPRASLAIALDDERRDSWLVDVPPALPIERLYFRPAAINESFRMSVYRRDPAPHRSRPHLFSRRRTDQWVPLGQVEVMRIMRSGVEVRGDPLALSVPTDRLRLDAVGPMQGNVPVVEADWRPARIAFVARGPGPYFLAIGHAEAKPGPQLDLRIVLTDTDRAGIQLPVATIGTGSADQLAVRAAGQQRLQRIATEARWSRYMLWAVLLAAVAAMAWMAWRLSVQLRK